MATTDELMRTDSLDPTRYPKRGQSPLSPSKAVLSPSSQTFPSGTFCYAPLDDPSEQIRLCRILPNGGDSELMVMIEKYDILCVAGCFAALSYACGDESSKIPIRVNGIRFDITQNLHTQVSRLRVLGYAGMLWIDALCINQLDEAEKMAQVSVMDRIYSEAEGVLIGFDEGLRDLRQAASDHAIVAAVIIDMANGTHFDKLFSSRQTQAGDDDVDLVLCRFFGSCWWWRTWVIQEVCLASKRTVILGSGFLPWDTLARALDSWDRHRRASCCSSLIAKLPRQLREAFHRVYCHVASIQRTKAAHAHEQHFLEAMLRFQHLNTTIAVDKINAFRGLHTKRTKLPPPDYSSPTARVFEEMAVWLLKDRCCLISLALDLKGDGSVKLPSWVMDFSAKPPIEPNYWRGRLLLYEAYTSRLQLGWQFEHRACGELCLYGIEVDQVSAVTSTVFEVSALSDATDHIELLKGWYTFATGRELSSLGNCVEWFDDDTFCATMLGGFMKDPSRESGVREAKAADYVQWQHELWALPHSKGTGRFHGLAMESHVTAVLGRTIFRTTSGSFGVGPSTTRPGDSLWLFNGGNALFIMRKRSMSESMEWHHTLLGHCYHKWLMDSRGASDQNSGELSTCVLV